MRRGAVGRQRIGRDRSETLGDLCFGVLHHVGARLGGHMVGDD